MTPSIWEHIAETSWWVYLCVMAFFVLSWLAAKPRIVPVKRLLVGPSFFIPFSIICILFTLPINVVNISIWLATAIVGILLGWLQFRLMQIKAIKDESLLYIPGTRSLFILLFLTGTASYYYDFSINDYLLFFTQANHVKLILAIYGFLTGLLIGKIIYSLRCIKTGPFLSPSSN